MRLFRTLIVSIAVLILLVAAAVYWITFRPLPKTEGEIAAPISTPATIARDGLGVPHIDAGSIEDALFLQGYATAQDRLWQMDNLRRFAAGELAEVYGAAVLEQDRLSRAMQMRPIARKFVNAMSEEERKPLDAYARGVNFYLDSHRGRYGLEFSIPHRYEPRRWQPEDSILVSLMMFRDLTSSWQTDMARGELFSKAKDRAKAEELFPPTEGDYISPGSNSWAVSGSKAIHGKPILASDPHLGYSIPSIWHMAQLKAPGLNVIGVALPGVPGIIIGHNDSIAWGMTNIGADYQDVYAEEIDTETGIYRYRGEQLQAAADREQISVYGAKPVETKTWITRHGPVVATCNGKGYALRWTAFDSFSFPILGLDLAQNWQQFRESLKRFWGPPQNLTYADRFGTIGYQAVGGMPIRKGCKGNVPLDGTSGECEWAGYVPFDALPSFMNPASGIIATANQNPFPPDTPFDVEGNFADEYRVKQIRARLQRDRSLSVSDMLAIQTDVYSAYHHFLAAKVVEATPNAEMSDAHISEAVEILRNWNGQMDRNEAAPLITELLNRDIAAWLVGRVAPGVHVNLTVRPHRIQRLLEAQPTGWVENDNWPAWLIERLREVIGSNTAKYGDHLANWRYGNELRWTFKHPIGSHLPFVDSLFDIGPAPMSGAGTSVKQTSALMGPSMRMVVDWGEPDSSVQNIATGESGHVASVHYRDQWDAYYSGKSFPMQFKRVDAKSTLHVLPRTASTRR